ncbi:hypothetical protein FACS1894211_00790 [Clostridia bacterium]|nr:hypothetical protein FACS1894211_00790 [Clostridia bacterium]
MKKELRVIELFSGVGSQTQALKNISVPHRVVAVSEIDPYADRSYRALHDKDVNNLGDIQRIAELPEADLWTYSFPCQDLSVSSPTQLGLRGARSGLLYEVERLLRIAKGQNRLPRFLLLENVKNLVGKRHKADYEKWLAFLMSVGYRNFWKVVNARDYLPQNRERVFCVSVLGGGDYEFPAAPVRTARLKDFLDAEVDGRYYLKIDTAESILKSAFHHNRNRVQTKDYCRALVTRDWHGPVCVPTGKMESAVWDMLLRLTDVERGGIPLPARDEPIIVAQRGRNPDNPSGRMAGLPTEQRFEFNRNGVCNTLTTVCKDNLLCEIAMPDKEVYTFEDIFNGLRIRKLTEREYWRLMGWRDGEIDKVAAAGVSARQMYRQSGNGIVVPVLEAIFSKLFKGGGLWN